MSSETRIESLGWQLSMLALGEIEWGTHFLIAKTMGLTPQTFSAILKQRRLPGRDATVAFEVWLGVPGDSWSKAPIKTVSAAMLLKPKRRLPRIKPAPKRHRKAS